MMSATGPNPYLRTRIMTASPTELRLMLYEGAIKFCRQAHEALTRHEHESAFNCLLRAQKIVLELSTSLNPQVAPELCDKLAALYTFIYKKLVDAGMNRDAKAVEESIRLLEFEKETWQMLMKRLAEQGQAQAHPDRADLTGAQQTAISTSA